MYDAPEFDEQLGRLNDLLAELYPNSNDARRIVTIARIPSGSIQFDEAARLNWFNILQEAGKHNRVANLIDVARREFPENPEWADVDPGAWPRVPRFRSVRALSAIGLVALVAVIVGLAVVFLPRLLQNRNGNRRDAVMITGHILYQNSDSVVKGAIVRLPDGSRKSGPTDDAGFFSLPDVPPQTPTLFVLVAGKLHELIVVNQTGFRYRVVPPIADPQPKLDSSQATAVTQLVEKQPGRFRIEGAESRHSSLWPIGATIRVAFLNGSGELRDLVRKTAPRWSDHANVTFQFDDDPKASDVRVSFKESGAYSYRGVDALGISKRAPTVVLGTLTEGSSDNVETILHEFGHVLGLVHEYQNPNAGRILDWDTIYKKAAMPPLAWTKQGVDLNLRPPPNLPKEYAKKPFDGDSVMMTMLPDDWFSRGVRVERRTGLSAGDRAFIAQLYPD